MKPFLVLITLLVVSLDADAQHWVRTAGPVEDVVFDMCIDSNGTLYAVTPMGVNRSTDGGALWTRPFVFPLVTTTGRIAVMPNGSVIVSSTTETFIARDSGSPFIIQDMGATGRVKQFATTGSGRIYAAHSGRFRFSDDSGATWEHPSVDGMLKNDDHSYAVAASHDTVISHHESYLYASYNNGATWELHFGFDVNHVKQLHIHPNGMWVCLTKYGVARYELPGDWYGITGIPDTLQFAQYNTVDIMRDGTMLVSTTKGSYMIRDTSGWIDINQGFAADDSNNYYRVSRFIEDPKHDLYYAATLGAGVWKSTGALLGRIVEDAAQPLSVAPNPFIDRTTVRFSQQESSWASIELRNILGAVVWKDRRYSPNGALSIHVPSIPAGNYLLVLRTNERTDAQWVTIIK